MNPQPKITPFLWFDRHAQEAVKHTTSISPDARILSDTRWPAGGPMPKGLLMAARFQIGGQEYLAFNGGPLCRFNEGTSLVVDCDTQAEIDRCWGQLTDGGQPIPCGRSKDKFGVTGQVVPRDLPTWVSDPDPARAKRVVDARLPMKKLLTAPLRAAFEAG